MKWAEKTLDELGTVSRGRSKHRPRDDPSLYGGKYPFIQTADVKNANFYISDYSQTYNETGLEQSKLWNPGTLCITIAANIAETGILSIDACFPDSIMGFIPYEGVSDVRFVKYSFDVLKKKFQQISQGTAQDNLSWEKLSTIKFPTPSLDIQRKIADILSAYDNLIENNQKQIRLLEEAARRLYKEWFVDFRFPGHESVTITDGVPMGWRKIQLGELIEYEIGGGWGEETQTHDCDKEGFVIRGTDLYGLTHGAIESIPLRYHSANNLSTRTLLDGDIVFEVSGGSKTEGVARTAFINDALLKRWNKPVMCASFCKLIRVSDIRYSQLLYDYLQYLRKCGKTAEYDKKSASSIVNYRWKDFLSYESVLIPDDITLLSYNRLASAIYRKIVNGSLSIELCANDRDRLLPKLMRGELEV